MYNKLRESRVSHQFSVVVPDNDQIISVPGEIVKNCVKQIAQIAGSVAESLNTL